MMPNWICCNACFRPPAADCRLAVTTCGHIICQNCFQKGKQGECLICKAQCQVSPLTDKSRPEVKALFSDVSVVANKYLSEISKVFIFQMRHQKRLLSHFRQKSMKLEEVMSKMKQEMHIMDKKMVEQKAYIQKLDTALQSLKAAQQSSWISASLGPSMPTAPLKQIPFVSSVELSQPPSASYMGDQMDMESQGLYRKPEISGSMPRLSMISPPVDGRMGTVSHRSNCQTSMVTHSARSATVSRDKPYMRSGYSQSSLSTLSSNLSNRRDMAWETPSFNLPRHSSQSSLSLSLPTFSLQGRVPQRTQVWSREDR